MELTHTEVNIQLFQNSNILLAFQITHELQLIFFDAPHLVFVFALYLHCIGIEFPNSAGISNSWGSALHCICFFSDATPPTLAAAQINVKVALPNPQRGIFADFASKLSLLQIFTDKNVKHAPGPFHFLYSIFIIPNSELCSFNIERKSAPSPRWAPEHLVRFPDILAKSVREPDNRTTPCTELTIPQNESK